MPNQNTTGNHSLNRGKTTLTDKFWAPERVLTLFLEPFQPKFATKLAFKVDSGVPGRRVHEYSYNRFKAMIAFIKTGGL